jgi:hypothetical protein
VVAQYVLDGGGDRGDRVAAVRPRRGQQDQSGVCSAVRQPLGGERPEVLEVVRDHGPALTAGYFEDGAVAAADKILAVGHGVHVVAGLAQQRGYLRGQMLVQECSHERRARSPAAAAARPRSYSASLRSIYLSISSLYSP